MAKLSFSTEAYDAVVSAELDANSAATALKIAAQYLRNGEVVPLGLDRFLADAFGAALKQPAGRERNEELLIGLGLKRRSRGNQGRPRKTPWIRLYVVGRKVDELMTVPNDEGRTEKRDAALASVGAGEGLTKDQVWHCYRLFRDYEKAAEARGDH